MSGQKCPECSGNKKLTIQEFINKSKKIHNNKYDYSGVKYCNNKTKVKIVCKKHGEFRQIPSVHFNGGDCPECSGVKRITNREFIEHAKQIHGNKYDYSKTNHKNDKTKVIIICRKHGKFEQFPTNHLGGSGCCGCSRTKKLTTEKIKKRGRIVHNNKYDYSKTKYVSYDEKIIIICLDHGEFRQTTNHHLSGGGCPKCSHRISKAEIKWLDKIEKEQDIKIERNLTIHIGNKYFFPDGFCKETNTWYEYYGNFFHGNPNLYNPNNMNKMIKKTFGELYQKTLKREKLIKSAGYNLVVKWGK